MGRTRLKSSEKASNLKHLPKKSPRFNPLAGPSQPLIQGSHSRHLPRKSPRSNPSPRPSQPPLQGSGLRLLQRRSPRFNPSARPPQPPLQGSDSRRLRKSPRCKPLARAPQPPLLASYSRHLLRRSPRFNPLARPSQRLLRNNKQKERQGGQIKTLKKKLAKKKANAKSNEPRGDQTITSKQKLAKTKANEKSNEQEEDQGGQTVPLNQELAKTEANEKITSSENEGINITLLPEEILIKIFSYLSQNQLGYVARVCKTFNEYSNCPILWKKVDVKFSWFNESQNEIASIFAKKLSTSVIHMKLDFVFYSWNWRNILNIEQLCLNLKERCLHLHTLILQYTILSENLPSVIDMCSEFFPNLKALTLSKTIFGPNYKKRVNAGVSKIEVLTVFQCGINGRPSYTFPKIPCLKKLNFTRTCARDCWFLNNDDVFSLNQLKVLHVGNTNISYKVFRKLKTHAVNLTELSLCFAKFIDSDFSINNSIFPHLKTICLRCCPFITCEGIVSLAQSCQSLENIFVDRSVAESYANHPFVAANMSKLEIVKAIDTCDHFEEVDYLLD